MRESFIEYVINIYGLKEPFGEPYLSLSAKKVDYGVEGPVLRIDADVMLMEDRDPSLISKRTYFLPADKFVVEVLERGI